ncbi:unnamed protein product [Phytophthora lilii]|uniref:Unnamed protein product n=1 Tax=Phytophthora lilii TaxID=2077276 RepID=A0A9W6TMA4_9STRA|nr:unnamed protein product [Phytophthora lilii]
MNISTTNDTSSSDSVNVSVTVTNSAAEEVLEDQLECRCVPTVTFELAATDWSVYYPQIGQGQKLVAEDADYVVAIKPETDCDVYNETAAANPLCATFTLSTGEYPYGSLVAE